MGPYATRRLYGRDLCQCSPVPNDEVVLGLLMCAACVRFAAAPQKEKGKKRKPKKIKRTGKEVPHQLFDLVSDVDERTNLAAKLPNVCAHLCTDMSIDMCVDMSTDMCKDIAPVLLPSFQTCV